jgi:hypothetical protein
MPSNLDVDATAERLTPTANVFLCQNGVYLRAAAANTGVVYVGFADTVTAGTVAATDGYPLSAGQEWLVSPGLVLNQDCYNIWVIASAANQAVFFLPVTNTPLGYTDVTYTPSV